MSKLKNKFMASTTKQDFDINKQIADLDERKVRLTFRDIWVDYRNFRQAYYFFQI